MFGNFNIDIPNCTRMKDFAYSSLKISGVIARTPVLEGATTFLDSPPERLRRAQITMRPQIRSFQKFPCSGSSTNGKVI